MKVRLFCACCALLASCNGDESDPPPAPIEASAPEQARAAPAVTKTYRLGPFDVRFEPPGSGWIEHYEPEMGSVRFDKQGTALTRIWLVSTCNGVCADLEDNLRYAATEIEAELRKLRGQLRDVAHVDAPEVEWVRPFERSAPGTWKWKLVGPARGFSGEAQLVLGIERWQSGWDRILSCHVHIDPAGSADAARLERSCSTLKVRIARR